MCVCVCVSVSLCCFVCACVVFSVSIRQFSHPNVSQFICDSSNPEGTKIHIVSELADGDLATRVLRNADELSVLQRLVWAREILEGYVVCRVADVCQCDCACFSTDGDGETHTHTHMHTCTHTD
jgi:hypothetical protein